MVSVVGALPMVNAANQYIAPKSTAIQIRSGEWRVDDTLRT
jgi:hypothetical protein